MTETHYSAACLVAGRLGLFALTLVVASATGAQSRGNQGPGSELRHSTEQMSARGAARGALLEKIPVLRRADLVRAVLERNPGIEAARQGWQAALERQPQVRALADPTLSYRVAPASIGSDEARFGQILGFSQRFPFPGTLRLKWEMASLLAEAARQDYEAVRLRLATLASVLFDDYYLVERALEINAEHIQLLEEFKRIATAYYAAGTVSQQDPIQAEVELVHLLHQDVVLKTRREVLQAQINALLHQRPQTPLPPPPSQLPAPQVAPSAAELIQEEALVNQPELRAIEARVRALEAGVNLKKLDLYPDFEAMTSYNSMWNIPEHRWTVGVGINVPIWRKRIHASVAEAAAHLAQAENEQRSVENEIRSRVQQAYSRLREAHHVVELYENRLVPAARDQVRAALSGFKTGRNSFLTLVEAEKNQRTIELSSQEALADFYRSRAELDRALGRLPVMGSAGMDSPGGTDMTLSSTDGELR